MNSTFARTDSRTEFNSSQRKKSLLSNGKSENGFVYNTIHCNFWDTPLYLVTSITFNKFMFQIRCF